MSQPKLPWEVDFTGPGADQNLISQVTGVIQGATGVGAEIAGQVAGQIAGPTAGQAVKDVGSVIQMGEAVAGAVVGSMPQGIENPNAPGGGNFGGAIEAAADAAIKVAIPVIQKRVASAAADALQQELDKLGPAPIPSIPKKDLKKVDAWERAGRTFMAGIAVTILGAIVQVIGQATTSGIDFFHKEGWVAVGTLFVAAMITSTATYILRIINEPAGAAVDSSAKT